MDKCIDIIATAIWAGLTVDELSEMDLAYAPPFSPVMPPLLVASGRKDWHETSFLRGALERETITA